MFKGLSYRPHELAAFTSTIKHAKVQHLVILSSEWAFANAVLAPNNSPLVIQKLITLTLFNFEISYLFEAWSLGWFIYNNSLQPIAPFLTRARFNFKLAEPTLSTRHFNEAEPTYPRYKTNPQRCVWLRWKRHLHNLETYNSICLNKIPRSVTLKPVTFSANKLFF